MNAHTNHTRWLWLAPLAMAIALLGILLVLLPAHAQGSVHYVAPGGSDGGTCTSSGSPCLTVAYAIGQAGAGDTIYLAAGTYTENLTVDRALTIIGEDAATTIIDGGGADRVFTMTADVSLSALTIQHGAAVGNGGAIQTTAPLTLTAVAVISNATGTDGGAIYNNDSGLTLTNVTFSGNFASSKGGAIYNNGGSAVLTNILFSGNKSNQFGGAISGGSLRLTNVTFSGNQTSNNPGGALHNTGIMQLVNVVLWGNSAGGAPGHQIYNAGGTIVLSHTLVQSGTNDIFIQGGSVTTGPGVITTDPLFVAPIAASSAPTTTGNYRLQAGSPAIDSGDNSAVSLPTDLDGNARIQGGAVDMGAYEATPYPDVTLSVRSRITS